MWTELSFWKWFIAFANLLIAEIEHRISERYCNIGGHLQQIFDYLRYKIAQIDSQWSRDSSSKNNLLMEVIRLQTIYYNILLFFINFVNCSSINSIFYRVSLITLARPPFIYLQTNWLIILLYFPRLTNCRSRTRTSISNGFSLAQEINKSKVP